MQSKVAEVPGTTRSSVDNVAAKLVGLITLGEISPGEQLRQEDLAERLNVSRVPVREALHALSELGLLTHERHRGFFVSKRSRSELLQIARLLELIETELIKSLEWPDKTTVNQLKKLNNRMGKLASEPEWIELIDLNQAFHFIIFDLSPLTLIRKEAERLWRLAAPYIIFDLSKESERAQTVAEHAALIDALVAQDRHRLLEVLNHHRSKTGLPVPSVVSTPLASGRPA
jgi:DNA-binding GntR family transcriptional regulator